MEKMTTMTLIILGVPPITPSTRPEHHPADILEGKRTMRIEKADLDYNVDPRNLGPFNRTYKPSRTSSPSRGYTSYSRSYDDPIEATPSTNRPHIYKSTQAQLIPREFGHQFPKISRAEWEARPKIEAARTATDEMIQKEESRNLAEVPALFLPNRAPQEEAEANAAAANKAHEEAERLWRAEYPEGPRSHLRAMQSFSKLYNKDTISRDSTIGNEARMDDLLACVGKRMMKSPFWKEPRGENSDDGEELGGHAMNYRNQIPRAKPPADRNKLSQYDAPWQRFSPPPSPPTELGESEDEYEDATPAPSPRPTWADESPRRPATRAAHARALY
ncbi:hypothetical protein FOFC_10743 [Fusarium oxysporum]|nr:hypothetical protein FOFC_10743 [Fusarium oxysporum]